ncbi:hypothetical protein EON68_00260 [archaeon]|nr:MAG: hypothetical protein EON68_00260 [archaeon]
MEALWTNRAQWEQVLAIVFGAGMLRLRGGRLPACMMLPGRASEPASPGVHTVLAIFPTPHPLQNDVWSR